MGVVWTFLLSSILSPLSPSLWEAARYRLKYCLKGPLNPKPTNQPNPQTFERYISFSLGNLRFIDSFQFLTSSLETLVENLESDGHYNFEHFPREFSEDHAKLLLRKGVYPYDYMDSTDRFQEKKLPSIQAFHSNIKGESISESDYVHATEVFNTFKLKDLGEYHDLYLKTDVVLLCDVFEHFRNMCMQQYGLDPCHYYSSPGLSWSACLKKSGACLELLTDIDMLNFIEKGLRGGISFIANRYKEANNPLLGEQHYDSTKPTSYLQYLDMNNLYGYAMAQKLPTGLFRFLDEEEMEEFNINSKAKDGSKGYILEVSLTYPEQLHDLHSDYPLAPERKKVDDHDLSPYATLLWKKLNGKKTDDKLPPRAAVEKLLTTLSDKDHYVVHYRTLQLYIQQGMEIKQIHRVLEFHQEAWMKSYIDFNTEQRKKAKTTFQKNFYKLMNCAVFGE